MTPTAPISCTILMSFCSILEKLSGGSLAMADYKLADHWYFGVNFETASAAMNVASV